MGNTNTSQVKRDRNYFYTIDGVNHPHRDISSSPRADDSKSFDFVGGGRKKPLLYQSSTDYSVDDGYDEYKIRPRTSTISQGTSIDGNALPTVFKWEGGGKEVLISGTFSDWKPIKMVHSHGNFIAIVDVPEGVHHYKFIVDGNETVNTNATLDEEKTKNVINVKKSDFEVFEALAMDLAANNNSNQLSGSPPGSYSQEFPSSMQPKPAAGGSSRNNSGGSSGNQGAGPPILPPHLLQVMLNNPTLTTSDPTFLPQPNHVMLNHLYALSIKDGVMVLSCTNRYRRKYVTTLLYKPI
ncbi:5'-AMP-activated protein kinase subunit beta-1-like [Panonychus citri]|uniref:5'-AMP-activated protein kinase subunit beta-1-like n=1 Tax=Panonychus citri TaxID=50023 RepID=UPI00230782FB|nr:5'-AMP-activated protein kinase subunit beta-1-like [Panonychus citri]